MRHSNCKRSNLLLNGCYGWGVVVPSARLQIFGASTANICLLAMFCTRFFTGYLSHSPHWFVLGVIVRMCE